MWQYESLEPGSTGHSHEVNSARGKLEHINTGTTIKKTVRPFHGLHDGTVGQTKRDLVQRPKHKATPSSFPFPFPKCPLPKGDYSSHKNRRNFLLRPSYFCFLKTVVMITLLPPIAKFPLHKQPGFLLFSPQRFTGSVQCSCRKPRMAIRRVRARGCFCSSEGEKRG